MRIDMVINEENILAITPASETERLFLQSLLCQENEIVAIKGPVTILGQHLTGGILIRRRAKNADTAEIQEATSIPVTID